MILLIIDKIHKIVKVMLMVKDHLVIDQESLKVKILAIPRLIVVIHMNRAIR